MLYILSSSHLNIIGTLEHVPACLHLGFGEAYFRNENEKAKVIPAFQRALDRSLLRFYWCETCSSPESFTAQALFLMKDFCHIVYSQAFTSSLVIGQLSNLRMCINHVYKLIYIFN